MKSSSGRLVYRCQTSVGPVEVREDANHRWMHFGSDAVQTAMALTDVTRLVAPYTRRMMAALLFQDAPRNVALLGLGAGALARFILHHLPAARLDAVEVNPQVLAVAREFFGLPDSPRLRVFVQDAMDYLVAARDLDLLLIDLFDAARLPAALHGSPFFESCRRALSAQGVAVLNLLSRDDKEFAAVLARFRAAFAGRSLCLPVPGYRNVVVLGFAQPPEYRTRGLLTARARVLDAGSDLGLEAMVMSLFSNNPSAADRLKI